MLSAFSRCLLLCWLCANASANHLRRLQNQELVYQALDVEKRWLSIGSNETNSTNIDIDIDMIDNTTINSSTSISNEQAWAEPTVGAFYYAWHSDDFHNDEGYLREKLNPQQEPSLGEYDDSDKKTVLAHIDMSRQANMQLWIASWWGIGKTEDVTLQDSILKVFEKEQKQIDKEMEESLMEGTSDSVLDKGRVIPKIALFYESTNRLQIDGEWDLDKNQVKDDIKHMTDKYWKSPHYYTIDNKPVLFIYLTRALQSVIVNKDGTTLLEEVVALMRSTAKQDIYIVGDHAFGRYPTDPSSDEAAQNNASFAVLDAITNYDVYGYMIGRKEKSFVGQERIDFYFEQQAIWKRAAEDYNCSYIPSVTPGFNDQGRRPDVNRLPLARRLDDSVESAEGSFFRASLQAARKMTDPKAGNLLVVNSFNEWHEDTQIEPVAVEDKENETNEPTSLTTGITYVGYGDLYLNILHNETTWD